MLGAAALDELERNPPSIGRQHTTLLAAMGAAPHAHAHANLQGDISCNSYTSEIETPMYNHWRHFGTPNTMANARLLEEWRSPDALTRAREEQAAATLQRILRQRAMRTAGWLQKRRARASCATLDYRELPSAVATLSVALMRSNESLRESNALAAHLQLDLEVEQARRHLRSAQPTDTADERRAEFDAAAAAAEHERVCADLELAQRELAASEARLAQMHTRLAASEQRSALADERCAAAEVRRAAEATCASRSIEDATATAERWRVEAAEWEAASVRTSEAAAAAAAAAEASLAVATAEAAAAEGSLSRERERWHAREANLCAVLEGAAAEGADASRVADSEREAAVRECERRAQRRLEAALAEAARRAEKEREAALAEAARRAEKEREAALDEAKRKKRMNFGHMGETGCDIWGKGGCVGEFKWNLLCSTKTFVCALTYRLSPPHMSDFPILRMCPRHFCVLAATRLRSRRGRSWSSRGRGRPQKQVPFEFADTPPFPHMSHPVSPICPKLILPFF